MHSVTPKKSNTLSQCAHKLITLAHDKEGSGYHDDKGVIIAKLQQPSTSK